MSDITIGLIAAGIPIALYGLFRIFFAQDFVNGLIGENEFEFDSYPSFDIGNININTFQDLVTWKKIDTFGGLVINVLRLSIGPQSIPNKILRTTVVFPFLTYTAVFCVAEMWGLQFLHWFCFFLALGVICLIFIEIIAELLVIKFFREEIGVIEVMGDIARILFSVLLSAVFLSFIGVFTPVHLIGPEGARIALVLVAVITLLILIVEYLQPGLRILFLQKRYIFGVLATFAIVIIILFGFLGYGEEEKTSSSSVSSRTSISASPSPRKYTPPLGERECSSTPTARYERSIGVVPSTDCWSKYIQIPFGVSSYKPRSEACFSAWFPDSSGKNYVEGEKGIIFSCDEILKRGLSDKGKRFRLKNYTTGNMIEFFW